jgi:hypothetical protein
MFANTAGHAATRVKALKLNQSHAFFGKCEVEIARTGIRVVNHGRFEFILVARAPDWKVTVYRNDDKTYFTESLELFEGTGLISEYHFSFRQRYLPSNMTASDVVVDNFPAKKLYSPILTCQYLPAQMIQPQIEKIAYGMYKLSTQGGFPLTFIAAQFGKDWLTGEDAKAKLYTYLSTQKIERVSVDPADFTAPKSLKKVDSLLQVLSSTARRNEATTDFSDLFGK